MAVTYPDTVAPDSRFRLRTQTVLRLVASFAILHLCLWTAPPTALAAEATDNPVEGGRNALGKGRTYPWYDVEHDNVKAIPINSAAEDTNRDDTSSRDSGEKSSSRDKTSSRDSDEEHSSRDSSVELRGAMAGVTFLAWLIVGAVVVLIAAFVFWAILASRDGEVVATAGKTAPAAIDLAALPIPASVAESDLVAQARRLYERGEFGQAMVFLYSHLLVLLNQGHIIRLAKGKTNRQYLREVGARRSLRDLFEQAMNSFEEAFFGRRDLDRARFESSWQRLDEFHRLIEEAAR